MIISKKNIFQNQRHHDSHIIWLLLCVFSVAFVILLPGHVKLFFERVKAEEFFWDTWTTGPICRELTSCNLQTYFYFLSLPFSINRCLEFVQVLGFLLVVTLFSEEEAHFVLLWDQTKSLSLISGQNYLLSKHNMFCFIETHSTLMIRPPVMLDVLCF